MWIFKPFIAIGKELDRTVLNPNWWRKVRADHEQDVIDRFGADTPYSMRAAEDREKADRSTEYWQKKFKESKRNE